MVRYTLQEILAKLIEYQPENPLFFIQSCIDNGGNLPKPPNVINARLCTPEEITEDMLKFMKKVRVL